MTPNTTVTLYQTDFDITNKHVVYVQSEGEAFGAVSSFPSKQFTNCYWQRTGRAFRARGNINELQNYNYCVYENNGTRNYAFITGFEYHNDDYTDVYLTLDWWLNYAGKYAFHLSPMVRQHPVNDNIGLNLYSETYGVERVEVAAEYENIGTSMDNNICLVTQVSTTDEGRTVTFWEAVGNTFAGNGGNLADYYSDVKMYPCDCIEEIQGNTSIVSVEEAQQIVENFIHIGQPQYVISAYKIPKWCRTVESGKDIRTMAPYTGLISLPTPINDGLIKWNKIRASKQYNKITVTIYGEPNECNIELFLPEELNNLQFAVICNQSANGCIAVTPMEYGYKQGAKGTTVFTSPTWDSVVLLGNVNQPWYQDSKSVRGVLGGAGTLIGMATFGASLPVLATSAILNTVNNMENFNQKLSGLFSSNSGRMSSVAANVDAIRITRFMPDETSIEYLNRCFSMYGYSFGGSPQIINLHNMPVWNYVETNGAVITGKEVPQWAIDECIKAFDSGIFIYNGIGNYKKTELVDTNIL